MEIEANLIEFERVCICKLNTVIKLSIEQVFTRVVPLYFPPQVTQLFSNDSDDKRDPVPGSVVVKSSRIRNLFELDNSCWTTGRRTLVE